MHSGTVPVERMGSLLEEVMPSMAQIVSPRWLRSLARLAFIRIVYSRYNAGLAPPALGGW